MHMNVFRAFQSTFSLSPNPTQFSVIIPPRYVEQNALCEWRLPFPVHSLGAQQQPNQQFQEKKFALYLEIVFPLVLDLPNNVLNSGRERIIKDWQRSLRTETGKQHINATFTTQYYNLRALSLPPLL